LRRSFKIYLEDSGYRILCAENGKQGLELFQKEQVDLVFTDLLMPVMDGLQVIAALARLAPDVPVIVISGAGSVQDALEALRLGASDYLVKPVQKLADLEHQIKRALETTGLRREVQGLTRKLLSNELHTPEAFSAITTRSPKMLGIFRYLEVIAPTDQPILLQGATGTGKELLARAVHTISNRKGRFVAVNVAGLDDHVFSDTLFGHIRGAYTGADTARDGLVAQAAGGTLLLDEIGDLSESSQVKLLRLLQEGEYYPLGSDRPQISKTRFLLATHQDISLLMQKGRFRPDLYYRLSSHSVQLPTLHERQEDLPLLLEIFIAEAETLLRKRAPDIQASLLNKLRSYHFAGNIRELKAIVTDAVARYEPGTPHARHTPSETEKQQAVTDAENDTVIVRSKAGERIPTLQEAENILIRQALQKANGNQGQAAIILGISRTALNKRLAKLKAGTKPVLTTL